MTRSADATPTPPPAATGTPSSTIARRTRIERGAFYVVLAVLTVAMIAVVLPFWGAVMWGAILALLFHPLEQKLEQRWKGRRNLAAFATLAIILLLVVLPLTLVGVLLTQEASALFAKVRSGEVNFGGYFDRIVQALPAWATEALSRVGIDDLSDVQRQLTDAITKRGQAVAGQAVGVGSYTLDLAVSFCVAMYLLFFLLRDGPEVSARIRRAIPLGERQKSVLLERFVTVLRATVKGNVVVAIVQGALGGLAFWVLGIHGALLWAVVMAFLSLLPAVGAAIVWGPVAVYLIATGAVWQGIGLVLFGVVVIGLVDNLLRPLLVGKDIQLPDYVVLIATIGGLSLVGISGFVVGPLAVALCFAAYELLAEQRRQLDHDEQAVLDQQARDGRHLP